MRTRACFWRSVRIVTFAWSGGAADAQRGWQKANGAGGWAVLEGEDAGVGVALRYMAEEYPKALGVDRGGIDVFLWKDPDGGRLHFRRYAEEVAWHEGEGVYSDGLGTAKTSEFFIDYFQCDTSEEAPQRLMALLDWPPRCG